ncbi:MAG: PQQ-dependent sugar dehydrogenase [Pseudomonadota bacterium]
MVRLDKATAIVAALVLASFAVGGVASHYLSSRGYFSALKNFVRGASETTQDASAEVEGPKTRRVISIFTPLDLTPVELPPRERPGNGGGLSRIGDDGFVLLRFDGTFWRVDADETVTQLPLTPPPNGFDGFQAFAESDAGASHQFQFESFRYNDVEYFEKDGAHHLAISFTYFDAERRCHGNRVALASFETRDFAGGPEAWRTLYSSEPCLPMLTWRFAIEGTMAGGRIVYGGDGNLFLANGDYLFDGTYGPSDLIVSQGADSHYGGVVKIAVADGAFEVLTRGNRNMQGVAFDDAGGLWVTEHGMRGGDELNLIKPGANYGWPFVSYGTTYAALPIETIPPQNMGRHPDYQKPVFSFLPSIAISSLTHIKDFDPTWNGDLLAGGLRSQKLVRMRVENERVVFTEEITIGERIRDLEEIGGGKIAIWTDQNMVLLMEKGQGGLGGQFLDIKLAELPEDMRRDVGAVMSTCRECHSVEEADHEAAPSLARLNGRQIGSTSFYGYSDALRDDDRAWSRELLLAYLDDPEAFAPGTSMLRIEMEPEVREALVDLLISLSDDVYLPRSQRP